MLTRHWPDRGSNPMLDQQIQVPGWRGGDGDASYLDKTLLHQAMELSLDESVAGRIVLRLWARAAAVALVWYFFFGVIWLVSDSSGPSSVYESSGSSSGGGGGGLLAVASIGSFILFWLVFLLTQLQEPIGEWKVLLADRSAAKPYVYSQIHGRLRDRNLPISFTARRIRTGLGRDSVGDRVVLVDGHYTAYISVFEYGTSLYMGWMMWRTRRGATLVGRFLADVIGGMFGQADPVKLMLRTERPRAMREAVHSVCREGLHVAVEGLSVPESYGFPDGLPPIEDAGTAPVAAPPSVPVQSMPASLVTEELVPAPVPAYDSALFEAQAQAQAQYQQPYAQQPFDQQQYDQQQYAQQQYDQQAYAQYADQAPYPAPAQYPEFGYEDPLTASSVPQAPPQPQQPPHEEPHQSGFFSRPQPGASQEPYDSGYQYPDPQQQQQQQQQQQWGGQ
jgi:hypothetical protein